MTKSSGKRPQDWNKLAKEVEKVGRAWQEDDTALTQDAFDS